VIALALEKNEALRSLGTGKNSIASEIEFKIDQRVQVIKKQSKDFAKQGRDAILNNEKCAGAVQR